jgi:hypothetical protein
MGFARGILRLVDVERSSITNNDSLLLFQGQHPKGTIFLNVALFLGLLAAETTIKKL